ncbi:acetate--CoA ligase family protein [Achromobacter mucicolens]|uniref:acetate--CoA ligase family protein n=1 Tax=Achromobacter mucicolens TaxID=1389922 RepID=UPI001CBB700C|nr:acetate--CoA ligase family protein [Achromobacter mucicolens]MDH1524645.1 acetate--CoA ligase family protein [Achromobacter mucicolens]UAN04670.1 acetate--CoA ligase family protein [Achromobacter mucicolens]
MTSRLEPLLNPRSIAMIGASGNPGRIGGMPLELLTRFGFEGGIYPVNPKYQEVFGLRCWPDIEAVPEPVDLAVLAIAAAEVTPMLRRCHAKGIPAAIVYAAGFAEAGGVGARLQAELEAFVAESGMAVAGPNCMGFANLNTQAHTAFASVFKTAPAQDGPGSVSLLTQSGNVCAAVYAIARRVGLPFSHFINTGNEACLDFSQYLEYLAADPQTEIVLGYIEQLRDGGRFVRACRELERRGKLLIALKAGATDKGAQAVQSHTSALAGDRRVYAAAFRQLNVIEATDFAQMAHLASLARLRHRAAGKRVAVLTMSGALGAILADKFIGAGLSLPDLPPDLQEVLRGGIPDYGMVGNPVDVTGNVVNDPAFVRTVLQALGTSDAIDAVVVYAPGYMLDRMADALAEASRQHRRLFVAIDTGLAQSRAALREAEVAVFEDLGLAVAALAPYLLWCDARATRRQADQPVLDTVAVPALPCNEAQARAYVAAFGVPEAATGVARSADEAVRDARRVGYPVAVKILSPDIAHKTEAGGVALNLADDEAVRAAWADVTRAAARAQPGARIDGVMVQKMERGVAEIIVGATRDPVFGPVLTVGLGGVLTEIYQDTSHRLLPVDEDIALQMLRELKAFALLDGFRGKPRGDVAAACQRIVAIGNALLAAPAHVSQIEVNPLLIKEAGQGVAVLDALILPATP